MDKLIGAITVLLGFGTLVFSFVSVVVISGMSISDWYMLGQNPFPIIWILGAAVIGGILLLLPDEW